ncbi:hypothetical protein CASFOL_012215 [Castilleja foliolosa]|uniref:RING-type domain-containing protein n=1 Tax=Castilleja foliolosa TaxID=1961234 RepID=A0ABD3DQD0_9LAMI
MGSRRPAGYEYLHRFWMDDSLIPYYNPKSRLANPSVEEKGYIFEIQTNFKLKRRVVDEEEQQVMGSEIFAEIVPSIDDSWWLEDNLSGRLHDYWMSIDEIKWLVNEALDFAQQKMAIDAAKYACYSVIPVVVGLDVCTVQREGETIDDTMGRAIRPEHIFPLSLSFVLERRGPGWRYNSEIEKSYIDHKDFLKGLARYRPDDDVGLAHMEVCGVCLLHSRATPAAQVSYLPCCHAFHLHCFFRWFNDGKSSCPSCGDRVPTDLEKYDWDLENNKHIFLIN